MLRPPFDHDGVVLEVHGDVDAVSCPSLAAALDALLRSGTKSVTLDGSAVTFMDCGALQSLMKTARKFRDAGGSLRLSSPSRLVSRLLAVAGMDQTFDEIETPLRDLSLLSEP